MGLQNLPVTLCFPGLVLFLNTIAAPPPLQRPNHEMVILSSSNDSQDSQDAFLNAHNTYRAEVGVQPMTWNNLAAYYAQNFANQRITDCKMVHSDGPVGENLAWSSGDLSETEAVQLWGSEKVDYDIESNSCAPNKQCGHYTQIIWWSSIELGCGKVRCKDGGTLIVCAYEPPGNVVGQRPTGNKSTLAPAATPTSSASANPPMRNPVRNVLPLQGRKKRSGVIIGSIVGVCALFCSLGFILFLFWRKRKGSALGEVALINLSFGDEFGNGMGPREFSYNELFRATKNFAEDEKLGEGGFGSVYKGLLTGLNTHVAVKRVSWRSKQGIKEYTSEVKIISRLRHKNLVKLIGWCHEKELLLVYEFMLNGSLDSHLFKGRSLLPWKLRYKIVQGLASALLYLHEEADLCVLHRDIKTNNIMLDSEFNAKLGDFGLARLVDHKKGSQTTLLAGTMGYMAPECHRTGKVSKESDVYSFGVVTLEIACGRRSIEPSYDEDQVSLVAWVWEAYGNRRLLDVVDQKLSGDFNVEEMECLLILGLWCVHPDPSMRPSIKKAMQALNLEAALPNLPCKMPVPRYDIDIPSTSMVEISKPLFSNPSITLPR